MPVEVIIAAQLAQYREKLESIQQQATYIAGAIDGLEETLAQIRAAAQKSQEGAADQPIDTNQ